MTNHRFTRREALATTAALLPSSFMLQSEAAIQNLQPAQARTDWPMARARLELFTADPNLFRRLCQTWKPPQETTAANEVYLETPCVDGYLFMRTITGDIRCYDL